MDDRLKSSAAENESAQSQDPAELQRALRAQLAAVTGGLAPDVYANAWWDWYLNLAEDPPKQWEILQDAATKAFDNWAFALKAASGEPLPPAEGDARFAGDAWAQWPFNVYAHTYRNYVDWWQQAWSSVPGVTRDNERTLDFMARNALEAFSPANYLTTNPELLDTTRIEAGAEPGARLQSLARGRASHARGQRAERHRKIRHRPRHRRDARQSGDAQRAGRIDPVFAGNPHGVCRAGAHHPGLDHEVLRSRPVGEQFPGRLPGRQRPHGFHGVVEESGLRATAGSAWTTT